MIDFNTIIDPVEREFRAGLSQGKLLIRYCLACGRPHWYPRPICPHCGHRETVFRQASGAGTIYSLTRVPAVKNAPHAIIAYVHLNEGVTLLSNIVGANADAATIGDAVTAVCTQTGAGLPIPVFSLNPLKKDPHAAPYGLAAPQGGAFYLGNGPAAKRKAQP